MRRTARETGLSAISIARALSHRKSHAVLEACGARSEGVAPICEHPVMHKIADALYAGCSARTKLEVFL